MKKETNKKNGLVSQSIRGQRSFGERAADGLANWAGSWVFIISFFVFLAFWMATNVYAWINS